MSKKKLKGIVKSTKMQKTAVVAVDIDKIHPKYGKTMRHTKRYLARYEGPIKMGETVTIEESKQLSKKTFWKIVEKLEEGKK